MSRIYVCLLGVITYNRPPLHCICYKFFSELKVHTSLRCLFLLSSESSLITTSYSPISMLIGHLWKGRIWQGPRGNWHVSIAPIFDRRVNWKELGIHTMEQWYPSSLKYILNAREKNVFPHPDKHSPLNKTL